MWTVLVSIDCADCNGEESEWIWSPSEPAAAAPWNRTICSPHPLPLRRRDVPITKREKKYKKMPCE